MAFLNVRTLQDLLRRFYVILCVGFALPLIGAVIAGPLVSRLVVRLQEHPSPIGGVVVFVLGRLWVWALVPAAAYALARALPLTPWGSSVGLVLVGEGLTAELESITGGSDLTSSTAYDIVHVVTALLGIGLAAWAIQRGRKAAEKPRAVAEQQRQKSEAEYAEFLREAERLAAQPTSPADSTEKSSDKPSST